jgi:hypothetical protein
MTAGEVPAPKRIAEYELRSTVISAAFLCAFVDHLH